MRHVRLRRVRVVWRVQRGLELQGESRGVMKQWSDRLPCVAAAPMLAPRKCDAVACFVLLSTCYTIFCARCKLRVGTRQFLSMA